MIAVFFAYSHVDEPLLGQLNAHLSLLRRTELIETWHDRRIPPGVNWDAEIDAHIKTADVALLLVSADFLASDYCYGKELQIALARHRQGSAVVIPVILRDCDWQPSPLGAIQALPRDAQPITRWPDRDEAWTSVARGVRETVEALLEHRRALTAAPETEEAPPPAAAGTVLPTDRPYIVSSAIRVTEKNAVWWRVSWKVAVKNPTDSPVALDIHIRFLDADGFTLETERLRSVLAPAGIFHEFSAFTLVNTELAEKIARFEAVLG